ncbi:MAG: hypothetical protein AAF688_13155 [Bacteroidota bacterium]
MKRLFLLVIACLGFTFFTEAQQISENAIGLRFGANDGFGAEINYQRALGAANRLEVGLGLRSGSDYSGFKATGLYQWVWNIEGGFNWYAGAGGGLGSFSIDLPDNRDESETFAFIAGNAGIEYNFDFPLLISLDVRPELGFGDFRDDFDFDIALGVRYQF